MATPTLALIPSGYGTNKVYSVLPSDGSGDFTFGRTGTATRINKDKLIEVVGSNIPRLDYTDSGCPSLLLEAQITNLITYSQDFSQSAWTKSNSSIVSNSTISPDGTLNASKYTATNATNYLQEITSASNGSYVFSIFVKKIDLDIIRINLSDGVTGEIRAHFNLSNETIETTKSGGTITNLGADFEKYGNGWYKVNVNAQTNSGSNVTTYLESESLLGSFYIWGAMLEQSSYPTSYIPTTGTSVTRIAETAFKTGVDAYINGSEGVLFTEINNIADDSTSKRISLSDGSSSNRLSILFFSNSIGAIQVANGSININTAISGYDLTDTHKIVFKYKINDFAIWVNGLKIFTDTSGNTFGNSVLNQLRFDNGYNGLNFYGKTKDLRVYNTVLTDLEIETLTSFTSFNAMALALNYTIY